MNRKRHELAEKIRQITRGTAVKTERKKWETLRKVEIKQEAKLTAQKLIIPEQQDLKITTYYQPIVFSKRNHGSNGVIIYAYVIPTIEEPEKLVISNPYSSRKMSVKRKRKRSETYSRIEALLSKGKDILLLPEPSEESIVEIDETPEENREKNIMDLSEDILQRVFWHFSRTERCCILSRVCKTWYYILKNPIFWTDLEFSGNKVPTSVIVELINKSPLLRNFKLIQVPNTSVILHELCRNRTELKELAVRHCIMHRIDCVHVLLKIVSSFPQLEVLDLKGTEFQSKRFFTELCSLQKLKSLDLGGNSYLQPRDLMTISVNCWQLETLKVLDFHSSDSRGIRMTDENFSFIIKNLQNSLIHLEYDMQLMGNSAYLAILGCKNLEILCLTNCLFLTGKMFAKFIKLKNLKELTMTRAISLTSKDFEFFSEGDLSKIERLDISGCWRIDNAGLEAITKGLPNLKLLSLKNCKSVKGEDIRRISRCKNLSSLNIAHSGLQSNDLPEIATSMRKLRRLTVDHNIDVKESNMAALSPQLKIEVMD